MFHYPEPGWENLDVELVYLSFQGEKISNRGRQKVMDDDGDSNDVDVLTDLLPCVIFILSSDQKKVEYSQSSKDKNSVIISRRRPRKR